MPGDRLLTRRDVLDLTAHKKSWLFAEIDAGRFPAGYTYGGLRVWLRSEVIAAINRGLVPVSRRRQEHQLRAISLSGVMTAEVSSLIAQLTAFMGHWRMATAEDRADFREILRVPIEALANMPPQGTPQEDGDTSGGT